MKIIVAGANSFVGSAVIKALLKENHTVLGIIHHSTTRLQDLRQQYDSTLSYVDFLNLDEIKDTYDVCINFAWEATSGSDRSDIKTQLQNMQTTSIISKFAKKTQCSRFINAGSFAEFEYQISMQKGLYPTNCAYAFTKSSIHTLLEFEWHEQLQWVYISNIYGPDENSGRLIWHILQNIKNNIDVDMDSSCLQRYDFVYISDAVKQFLNIIKNLDERKILTIVSGESRTLREYLVEIYNILKPTSSIHFGSECDNNELPAELYNMNINSQVSFRDGIIKTYYSLFSKTHMIVEHCPIEGVVKIRSFVQEDNRGTFTKDFSQVDLIQAGIDFDIKETFYTTSVPHTIRGLHFQRIKEQGKIIKCLKGQILERILDLRPTSLTFGKTMELIINEKDEFSLLIPRGCAHGYYVQEAAIVSYKCDERFYAAYDDGIFWYDLSLPFTFDITENAIMSEKDKNLQSFKDFKKKIGEK